MQVVIATTEVLTADASGEVCGRALIPYGTIVKKVGDLRKGSYVLLWAVSLKTHFVLPSNKMEKVVAEKSKNQTKGDGDAHI